MRFTPILLPGFLLAPLHATTLWVEGENPSANTMHRHPWWFDQVKPDLLSGGTWICQLCQGGRHR